MPCLVNCASIRHWSVLSLWLLTSIYTLPKYKIHHCMQTNELKIIVLDCVIADKSLSALRCVLILADVIFYCLLHWIKNTDLWIKDPGFLVIQHWHVHDRDIMNMPSNAYNSSNCADRISVTLKYSHLPISRIALWVEGGHQFNQAEPDPTFRMSTFAKCLTSKSHWE